MSLVEHRWAHIRVCSFEQGEQGNRLHLEIRIGNKTLALETTTDEPVTCVNFYCGEWIRTAVLDPIQKDVDNPSAT